MSENIKYIQVILPLDKATFVLFKNHDEKEWLIPLKNMKIGLEIYEPSAIKGKILKKGLPLLTWVRTSKNLGQFDFCRVELVGALKDLLDSLFQNYEFSIFGGTPSTDQKITIQIFRNKKILGYCKIGTSKRTHDLFIHEKDILTVLENSNMSYVPRCKGVFKLDDTTSAFIQTTEKKVGAKVEHKFGTKHKLFLRTLFTKTKKNIAFEETDYYSSIIYLKNHITLLHKDYQKVVSKAVESVLSKYKGCHVLWGMCHRDFTPWNTCIVNNQLFVFDFEYALQYAPPEIDKWHFFVQTRYYEKKMNLEEIAHEFKKKYNDEQKNFEMYLLDNISMYILRGGLEDIKIANQKAYILSLINGM